MYTVTISQLYNYYLFLTTKITTKKKKKVVCIIIYSLSKNSNNNNKNTKTIWKRAAQFASDPLILTYKHYSILYVQKRNITMT